MKPYPKHKWNKEQATHLLNRAGFGANPDTLREAVDLGLEKTVDSLLNFPFGSDDYPAPNWLAPDSNKKLDYKMMKALPEEERREKRQAWNRKQNFHMAELRAWWMERMRSDPFPLREKMTLFLHGHFATAQNKVREAYPHYKQNQLFRKHAGGNWKKLTKEIARDPAMLLYLDNARSKKKKPNENFARELMELFTLGEGNYTEEDVFNAARAFTGWSLKGQIFEFNFNPRNHDEGEKSLFGKSGNFDGDDVVDLIFEQPAAANHLADHLIRFFVSDRPNKDLQEKLATVIQKEDFELKPILSTLFKSQEFYSPEFQNNKIKSPTEWLMGMLIQLETSMPPPYRSDTWLSRLGQKLFHPPNVKGWDGGFAWITASNLLNRYNFSGQVVQLFANEKQRQQALTRLGKSTQASKAAMTDEAPAMMADETMADSMMMNQSMEANASPPTPTESTGLTETAWPYGSQERHLVDVKKLIPVERRKQPSFIQEAMTSRLFPGGLRPQDQEKIQTLLEALPGSGPWTDQDVRTLIHLMMSTPQYQVI